MLPTGRVFLEPKAGMAAGLLHSLEQKVERHKSWSDLPHPALFLLLTVSAPVFSLSAASFSLHMHEHIFSI